MTARSSAKPYLSGIMKMMTVNISRLHIVFAALFCIVLLVGVFFLGRESGKMSVQPSNADDQGTAKNETQLVRRDISDYGRGTILLSEILEKQELRTYVNPKLRLALKYPESWFLSRTSEDDGTWNIVFCQHDSVLGKCTGSLEIQIQPMATSTAAMPIAQYLREVKGSPIKYEPYGVISGVDAVTFGNTVSFMKEGYFFSVDAFQVGSETLRRVLDSIVFLPQPIVLTDKERNILERNSWEAFANAEYGYAFEYPAGWWITMHAEHEQGDMEVRLENTATLDLERAALMLRVIRKEAEPRSDEVIAIPRPIIFGDGGGSAEPYRRVVNTNAHIAMLKDVFLVYFWKNGNLFILYAKNVERTTIDEILDTFIVNTSGTEDGINESALLPQPVPQPVSPAPAVEPVLPTKAPARPTSPQPWGHSGDGE